MLLNRWRVAASLTIATLTVCEMAAVIPGLLQAQANVADGVQIWQAVE